MIKNFVFVMLGMLLGLGVFGYGYFSNSLKNLSRTQNLASNRLEEAKKNLIIDPVQITNPEVSEFEMNQIRIQSEQLAQNQKLNFKNDRTNLEASLSQSKLGSQELKTLNEQNFDLDPQSLAQEILLPQDEPVIYEGWANAGFLPDEAQEPEIQINNLPESEQEIR